MWFIVSGINLLKIHLNVFHLTGVMSLHYVVKSKSKCSACTCYHWIVKETPEIILPNLWHPIHQIWIQLITECKEYCKRRNTHHWSGRTKTATKNGVGQAGSCSHCSSHSSVASSLGPDQWCVFCTLPLAIFPRAVIKWNQIWRLWRPQLRWDKFWSFFFWQLSGSTCDMSISRFTRWCRDIVQARWKTFTQFCSKFTQEIMYQISSESSEFYKRYYKKNHFCLLFSRTQYG